MRLPRLSIAGLALWIALPMARTSQVEGRLRMILNKTRSRHALTRGGTAAAAVLASALALALATAQVPSKDRLITSADVRTLYYQVQEIGTAAGFEDHYSLNDRGEVAGLIYEPEGKKRGQETEYGIVWTPEQPRQRLGTSATQNRYIPQQMNNEGTIIGQKLGKNGLPNWFVGKRDGLTLFGATPACQQLTAAGFQLSELVDLNDTGWLLFNADQKTNSGCAFLWHDHRLVRLKPLRNARVAFTSAAALNNTGWVAGTSRGQAALWKGDTPLGLGVLPGYASSEATGLNEQGDVIGNLYRKNDGDVSPFRYGAALSHAFVWHNGKMQDIGTLPGFQYAQAIGINDAGQVVGNSWNVQREPGRPAEYSMTRNAFLLQNGKMYDLQRFLPAGSPWRLEYACALNNRGQIVALAWDARQPPSSWQLRAILLTPK